MTKRVCAAGSITRTLYKDLCLFWHKGDNWFRATFSS